MPGDSSIYGPFVSLAYQVADKMPVGLLSSANINGLWLTKIAQNMEAKFELYGTNLQSTESVASQILSHL